VPSTKFSRVFGPAGAKTVRPSIGKFSIGIEEITPATAEEWLARSKRKNRRDIPAKINQFSEAMAAQRWNPYNSTGISFDTNGDLVNGHNRLKACAKAKVPFRSIVIRGVPPETFETEDTGLNRTSADFLEIAGEKNGRFLSAAGRALCLWERGMWRNATYKGSRPELIVRNDQLLEEVNRRPILRKAAAWLADGSRIYRMRTRKLHTGLVGALWCLTNGHPKHDKFWAELVDGIGVSAEGPVHMFRERVEAAVAKGHRLQVTVQAALLTKAWNFYASDRPLERLSYSVGREREFPRPVTKMTPELAGKAKAA
jgi:hypothetical protein